jgi:hypothetical protein
MDGIFRKMTVRVLGAQTRNVNFAETGVTGRTHFNVIGIQ